MVTELASAVLENKNLFKGLLDKGTEVFRCLTVPRGSFGGTICMLRIRDLDVR